ncbi:bifunctional adenosylcobinamide kinase/adenosylcobinamide-phosphate guanylyltransferase [Piscinibacter koreensis]|uniref:Bifunctional adenosylcobalamin biosynthesis protein n=1 Tax=Piscinibacter koreensis TaxID=2742824 RepID=A0A7Y6TXT2_9BURK|nr:bifunctional adenosylcobinamide kinase/adenosylcobinamide-phosphate guanylyltransferase [Schlegelella koreensis]NUZ07385.1 bifunctional adenosylcobinamide kinase/adenosylcobinamide-phosphate guanylyltransferase [Schlegelella koreensis]
MNPSRHELILGGAKSGKSRTAEARASRWLAEGDDRRATLVATALPGAVTGDAEMDQRIARHRADRAARVPRLQTIEAADDLGSTLQRLADPRQLIVVDCLTLWLTQLLMPPAGRVPSPALWHHERVALLAALRDSPTPVVLVSNEIGLGVLPLSREARDFVDTLGLLHQAVAGLCGRVTLMVAGCELTVKDAP